MQEDPEFNTGLDRGVVFEIIKKRLVEFLKQKEKERETQIEGEKVSGVSTLERNTKILKRKIIYCTIAIIQLRNGSRIREACEAYKKWVIEKKKGPLNIKIAKSEKKSFKKTGKDGKELTIKAKKPRFRRMVFPEEWISMGILKHSQGEEEWIKDEKMMQRVLDFMFYNFDKCNTHSLRYSFINYMLYTKRKSSEEVAKICGHKDCSMLTRYTQQKNADFTLSERMDL
jgi:hypothetical protein